jgi:hypothetical protein
MRDWCGMPTISWSSARSIGPRLLAWLEATLEQDLRLTVNRTKTE